jgi:hypothetical protein
MGRKSGQSETAAQAWKIILECSDGILKEELAHRMGYRDTHSLGGIITTLGLNYQVYIDGKRICACRPGDEELIG